MDCKTEASKHTRLFWCVCMSEMEKAYMHTYGSRVVEKDPVELRWLGLLLYQII